MIGTYKLLCQLRVEENFKLSNEELCKKYIDTKLNPTVLAELFCRNFNFWNNIACKFSTLDSQEIASIILDRISHSAQCFDLSLGFKYLTFATKVILTQLYGMLNSSKNIYNVKDIYSLDAMIERTDGNNFEENFLVNTISEYDKIDLIYTIINSDLSKNEKSMCLVIINNPGVNYNEIAEYLNIHRHTVRGLREKLQLKLKNLEIC